MDGVSQTNRRKEGRGKEGVRRTVCVDSEISRLIWEHSADGGKER